MAASSRLGQVLRPNPPAQLRPDVSHTDGQYEELAARGCRGARSPGKGAGLRFSSVATSPARISPAHPPPAAGARARSQKPPSGFASVTLLAEVRGHPTSSF